jgi:hypothetical protein
VEVTSGEARRTGVPSGVRRWKNKDGTVSFCSKVKKLLADLHEGSVR